MDKGRNCDMSGYLNRVQLIGNLGRDPEVRTTQIGKTVVTLVIATSESWKDDRGNRVERTEWHRIVIFNEGLGKSQKNTSRKVPRFTSKASSAPANGRTSRAQTATAPRSI
jgi:hypothetical protein